jgi:heme exporter protein CcmD
MSHDFYIGMSYGATALAMAVELVLLKAGRARALRLVDEERELETQD